MLDKETTIDGFQVELSLFEERGEPRSFCHVTKGRFNGSLELLSTGMLDDIDGNELAVSEATIDRITAWAVANGY